MAFEQNKPIEIQDVKDKLDGKVSTSDVISYEEIKASTDLSGKVPSASAIVNKCSCVTYGFANNDTIIITLPFSFNQLLFLSTYRSCGLYVVRRETQGNVFILPIKEAEAIAVTSGAAGTGQLTISNSNTVGDVATIVYD